MISLFCNQGISAEHIELPILLFIYFLDYREAIELAFLFFNQLDYQSKPLKIQSNFIFFYKYTILCEYHSSMIVSEILHI